MLAWGNAIGNEFYEYKLPADFRRPTNDQTAEKFIRSKYDKKLYCHDNFDYASTLNKHSTPDTVRKVEPAKPSACPVRVSAPTSSIPVVPLKTKASEAYVPPKLPQVQPKATQQPKAAQQPSLLQVSLDTTAAKPPPVTPAVAAPVVVAKPVDDLFDLFGEMVSAPLPAQAEVKADSPEDLIKDAAPKQSVKDSIMSLYTSANLATSSSSSFPAPQPSSFPAQFNQQQFNQPPAQQQNFQPFQGTQGNQQPQQFQQFQQAPQQQFQQFGNQQMLAQQQQAQQQLLNQLQGQNMQNFQQPQQQPQQQQFPQQFQQNNMQFNGFNTAPQQQPQQFFSQQGQQQFSGQQFQGFQQPSQQSQLDAVQKQLQGLKVAPPMQQAPQMWNFGTSWITQGRSGD